MSVLVLSCPRDVQRDPSYPPLVDSPSLPTPCKDREDGYTTRGGRWGFLFRPLGLVIAKPYSCRGLAWFLVLFCCWPLSPFPVARCRCSCFLFELRFLYLLRSLLLQDPWFCLEGVRVVLGRLPCPWSVSAFAVASSAC